MPNDSVHYKRARFSTRLPGDRRYTAAHYWLFEEGAWHLARRIHEIRYPHVGRHCRIQFWVTQGDQITLGQEIGSIEGFKALTALYSVAQGEFLGIGDDLGSDITLVESDPYGRGWLYRMKGQPDPASMDVRGYVGILDATIDRLLESRHSTGETQR